MLWFVQFNLLVVLIFRIKTIRQLTSLKKERLTDSRVQGKKKNILEDPLQRVTDNESHHIIIRGQQSREVTDTKHF
jgi:hypothetical protein